MINRTLVRVKVVQLLYAYLMQPGKKLDTAEKELIFSINKSLDLSKSLLQLIIETTDYQARKLEMARQKNRPTEEELNPNTKFIDNLFVAQLRENETLSEFRKHSESIWNNNEEFLRLFVSKIIATPAYIEYMSNRENNYDEDKKLWATLFKTLFVESEDLAEVLEENSLYWNDDLFIVQTFIMKLFNQSKEGVDGLADNIFFKYKNEEDIEFAKLLFRTAVLNETRMKEIIDTCTQNWKLERVAFMDVVIMICALAEIIAFPEMPLRVTFNEYIELAKVYSTAKSAPFINGVLDKAVEILRNDGSVTTK